MSSTAAAITVVAALALAGSARAQFELATMDQPEGNIEGLTVRGKGSVSARPNRLEIDLQVASASELTADAIVKYRDARRRLEEAFEGLKLDDVSIAERGLLVDEKGAVQSPYYINYGSNPRTKTEVQLSRKLIVECSSIRDMDEDALLQLVAKLLDVAQDAGGQVGTQPTYNPYYYRYNPQLPSLVRFVLDDFDALEEQAYEQAIADARARAGRLAKLGGVELGEIVGIREVEVPGESPQGDALGNGDGPASAGKRLESSKFQEIPVRVQLLVRFAVHPAVEGEARAARR